MALADTTGPQRVGLLVRGQFDTGDFAVFSGLGNVVWNGVTYRGAGGLISIGQSAGAVSDGKSGLSITLSGVDPNVLVLAETEEFQRRRVTVELAFFDDEGAITGTDVFFDGLADDMESDDDPASPMVTLHCEQRALDLTRPRPFKYLPEDQDRRYPGDTFFRLVQRIQNRPDRWAR